MASPAERVSSDLDTQNIQDDTDKPQSPTNEALHTSPRSPSLRTAFKIILFNSWINVLLIFLPLGYIAYALKMNGVVKYVLRCVFPKYLVLKLLRQQIYLLSNVANYGNDTI